MTRPDCDAEYMLLGIDHTELGSWVCRHWRFTSDVTDAIAGHHHPPPSGALTLIDIVHVADAITHALDLADAPERGRAWNQLCSLGTAGPARAPNYQRCWPALKANSTICIAVLKPAKEAP